MSTWCCKKQQRQRRKARITIHLLMTHSIQFNPCPSQFHQISCNSMKRDNLITWLKILWVLMGFLLFPFLYTFLPVFHKPYFIIGYVVMMMAAIYMIFIRERAEPVEPLAVLPPRSSLMAVINYSPGEGEEEEKRECVICLSEFEKDEELAKMGCCGSMFHAECVGKWAQSHSRTCPICHESYIISV